jgi:hypothetical protein
MFDSTTPFRTIFDFVSDNRSLNWLFDTVEEAIRLSVPLIINYSYNEDKVVKHTVCKPTEFIRRFCVVGHVLKNKKKKSVLNYFRNPYQ